jgi:hypothetical protein
MKAPNSQDVPRIETRPSNNLTWHDHEQKHRSGGSRFRWSGRDDITAPASIRREVGDELVMDRQVGRHHEEIVHPVRQVQLADERSHWRTQAQPPGDGIDVAVS